MIKEIPEHFKGTPAQFWEQAYYLDTHITSDGEVRITHPYVSTDSVEFSLGENGKVRADRLPEGTCLITTNAKSKDKIFWSMWKSIYDRLQRLGFWGTKSDRMVASKPISVEAVPDTKAEKIRAWKMWEALDHDDRPHLQRWLIEKYGTDPATEIQRMPETTFRGWKKLARNS